MLGFNSYNLPTFNISEEEGDVASRFKKSLSRFENFLIAANITEAARKKALLLHLAGEEIHDIFDTLPNVQQGTVQQDEYEQAKHKLKTHFEPKINKEMEIYKFRQTKQESNETTDQFYLRLMKLAKTCSFTDANEEIKSQIILNTNNRELRRYALNEQPYLDKLLLQARTIEATTKHLQQLQNAHQQCLNTETVNVDAISQKKN